MFRLPCPHVCVVIILRHDVYDYIDPCFKVSTQHLIYSGQFQPLPTHNMPKVCEAGTLQDGQGKVFPSLQPPQVRRPPGRPRQRCIELQFSHKRAIHCSRCNGISHNRSKCNNPLPWHVHFFACKVFILCTIPHYSIICFMVMGLLLLDVMYCPCYRHDALLFNFHYLELLSLLI